MYQYFPELESPKDFKTWLSKKIYYQNSDIYVRNIAYSDDILIELDNLFQRINFLDMLIEGLNQDLETKSPKFQMISHEMWLNSGEFFLQKQDHYPYTKSLKNQIELNFSDLESLLRDYLPYSEGLIDFFPNYKEFLFSTHERIKRFLDKMKTKNTIQVPLQKSGILYRWPNSWYITPNGYLYNMNGGHSQGKLTYTFYYFIYAYLAQNHNVLHNDYTNSINRILERGYITDEEFQEYAHLIYKLPTIVTPEVELDIERKNNILKMSEQEFEKMMETPLECWPHPERSYQKNLITLIIGYLNAKSCLFQSFARLNESKRKDKIIEKIYNISRQDLADILVRFSGFHKFESCEKKIVTSSLTGIKDFKLYLDKGYDLYIVPPIVYDRVKDDVEEMDFAWYYVNQYLDKSLEEYKGKGKVLIRNKNI